MIIDKLTNKLTLALFETLSDQFLLSLQIQLLLQHYKRKLRGETPGRKKPL
jgi:hypothetical protein